MSTARDRAREIRSGLLASNQHVANDVNRVMNVTSIISARVQEISQLSTSVSTSTAMRRIYQQLVRHKRRRAMAHDMSRIPKVLREAGYRELLRTLQNSAQPPSKTLHRNFRRSKKMRFVNHLFRAQNQRWLETHHYHAKRAHMRTRWGYRIPVRTSDKSERAVEKFGKVKAIVNDQSYFELVDIFAPIHYLNSVLTLTQNYYNTYVKQTQVIALNNNNTQSSQQLLPTPLPPYALSRLGTSVTTLVGTDMMRGDCEVGAVLRFPTTDSLIFMAQTLFPQLPLDQLQTQIEKEQFPWVMNRSQNDTITTTTTTTTITTTTPTTETISIASNLIVAPIRVQWVPIQSQNTQNGHRAVWCWVHPSSTHLVSTLFSSLLTFITHLESLSTKQNPNTGNNNTNNTDQIFTVGILSGQFSRLSLRGPKSTTILGRVLSQVTNPEEIDMDAHIVEKYSRSTPKMDSKIANPDPKTTTNNAPKILNKTPPSHRTLLKSISELPPDPTSAQLWNRVAGFGSTDQATPHLPNSTHINTSSQITPNQIISLKVFDPHSSLHRRAQNELQSGGRGVLSKNSTMSAMFRTHNNGPRFRIDKQLCVSATLDASFDKSRSKKMVDGGDKSGKNNPTSRNDSIPLSNFQPAGGITRNTQHPTSTSISFISAQWTPITSSSHPQRFAPPIPPAGAMIRKIDQCNDSNDHPMITMTDSTHDVVQTSNNLIKDTKTNGITISPLYNKYYLDQLITYSPGNIVSYNSALKRDLFVSPSTFTDHQSPHVQPQHLTNQLLSSTPDHQNEPTIKPTPLTPSPTTHVLLISRGPTEGQYSSVSSPDHKLDPNHPTLQLQYGWDLIIPRGWSRSFFTALCKNGGAVMVGHDQQQTFALEAQNYQDTFPHQSTYPNSLASALVTRARRWDLLIEVMRYRKYRYGDMFSYGVLGPAYWSLFATKKSQQQCNSENSTESTVVNHSGYRYTNTSPLCLPPPQQLHLLAEIRRWLYRLVHHQRTMAKKTRRRNRQNGSSWLSILTRDSKKPVKKVELSGHAIKKSKPNDSDVTMGNGDDEQTNTDKQSERTTTTTTTTTTKPQPKSSTKRLHPKSVSPIPNLGLFQANYLPPLPPVPKTTTLPIKRSTRRTITAQHSPFFQHSNKNPINLSSHSQVSTQIPLYSKFIASSRRSISTLLNSANDFHPKGQQTIPTPLKSDDRIQFKRRVLALITSPHSPYYFPPLAWLHKRTHQNQAFLKPIVLINSTYCGPATQQDDNVTLTSTSITNMVKIRYDNVDQNVFEAINLIKNHENCHNNPQFAHNFNVIDNIYYFYPLLLNTVSNCEVSHRNKGTLTPNNTLSSTPPPTQQAINSVLFKAIPRFQTLPISLTNLFSSLIMTSKRTISWIIEREWLIDAIILYAVLKHEQLDQQQQQQQQQSTAHKLLPIRLEQLSLGHVSTNGVIAVPTDEELELVFNHKFKSKQDKLQERKEKRIPDEFKNVKKNTMTSDVSQNIDNTISSNSSSSSSSGTTNTASPSTPIGFITHTHHSMRLGKPYGIGFVSINGYIDVLEKVLIINDVLIKQNDIPAIITRLANPNSCQNTTTKTQNPSQILISFDINTITLPLVVYGESNKKLEWAKIRLY